MANCNCNDFPISCAPHAPGGDCCHHHHGCPPHPCPPPDYKGGTSMYIGARYVPIFADPVEWDDEREYEPLTIVIKDGDCYTSKCYVPKGAQLPPYPENQTKYWVKTSDYNYQFADLKKTVTDLSRLVEQFQKDNEKFTELINGWNATVTEWTAKMTEWQGQMDNFEQSLNDLTAKLNEEIQRAKDAEQANAAAIAKETADREKAVSELDAAYKAADASIREDFTAADAAEKAAREAAVAQLTADIAAEKTRAEGQETAIREEFAAADTALSNRITSNKTDIDAIKAEQIIQNTNISNNAKNIADNAAEIAKHADRLTALESNASDWDTVFPDTTIAQEVQKEELARANADTALNGRCDAIAADVEEVRDLANHKVDTTTYTEGQAAQDAKIKANSDNIGAWSTDHPNQTISECVTSIENTVEGLDAELDTKANKTDLKDWVLTDTYTAGQAAQDKRIKALEDKPDVDLSGYVQTTTYTAGQAAQDKRIDAISAVAPNVYLTALTPVFSISGINQNYPIVAESTTANVSYTCEAYICDPRLTPKSTITFPSRPYTATMQASGASNEGVMYNITAPTSAKQLFDPSTLAASQIQAANGFIHVYLTTLISSHLQGAKVDVYSCDATFTCPPIIAQITIDPDAV